jgi:ammonia channel protein AmtB
MLFYAHSGIRYLVVAFGLAALVWALYGALTKRPYGKPMRILAGMFAGTLHLQILLGLGMVMTGRFYPQLIGHIFMMVFAAVAAQVVPSVMRRRPEEERTYWPHVVGTLVALALVYGGVAAIQRPLIPGLF